MESVLLQFAEVDSRAASVGGSVRGHLSEHLLVQCQIVLHLKREVEQIGAKEKK